LSGEPVKDERVVIELKYLETPKGKIPTYEFARAVLKALEVLDEVTSNLEERLNKVERAGSVSLDEIKERLTSIEEVLKEVQSRLDLEMRDLSDKISVLTDVFADLVERVRRIEESLTRG